MMISAPVLRIMDVVSWVPKVAGTLRVPSAERRRTECACYFRGGGWPVRESRGEKKTTPADSRRRGLKVFVSVSWVPYGAMVVTNKRTVTPTPDWTLQPAEMFSVSVIKGYPISSLPLS